MANPLATGGRRNPLQQLVLATENDVDGTVDGTQYLDLTGAGGCYIYTRNIGTNGTAGVDVIEFSEDGGVTWKAATKANMRERHLGLQLATNGTAVSGAALNEAGTEVNLAFFLGPTPGPTIIRCARGGSGAGGTAWQTGAPQVVAVRIG